MSLVSANVCNTLYLVSDVAHGVSCTASCAPDDKYVVLKLQVFEEIQSTACSSSLKPLLTSQKYTVNKGNLCARTLSRYRMMCGFAVGIVAKQDNSLNI